MEIFWTIQLLLGMSIITAGSGLLIYSLVHLARELEVKEYIIAFVLIGFATSFPEFLIAINSQLYGAPEIAFGNSIGTAIVSITLISGMFALFNRNFSTKNFFESHDFVHLSLSVLLLVVLSYDGKLSQLDGLLLVAAFFYYLWNLYQYKDKFQIKIKKTKRKPFSLLFVAVLSFFSIFLVADYTVFSLVKLQEFTKLPFFLLTITLLAPLGAVPELVYEFNLLKKKESRLSFGDLFTSVVINTSLIIGIIAIIEPFTIEISNLVTSSILFLVLMLLLFNYFMRSKSSLNWKEGAILIFSYILFIVSAFFIQIASQ